MKLLNLFYEELDPDRWLPYDRYPRRVIRRVVRGKPTPGGQMRVFLNLCAGLDKLGVAYRVNDYRYVRKHPKEIACIVGKPHVLDLLKSKNPILFGAAVFSHPIDESDIFDRYPIQKMLVPGEWMRQMFEPYYGDRVLAWPVGIETDVWKPEPKKSKDIDVLLYAKVRWKKQEYELSLISSIRDQLTKRDLNVAELCYGFYKEEHFHALLARSKSMIFLCEHETQGIAYQQALSCGVPILAWDRGGYWQDPSYYPDRARFFGVSSVPYWDDRCGIKFKDIQEFPSKLDTFLNKLAQRRFSPRDYILENLTLEICAQRYLEILEQV